MTKLTVKQQKTTAQYNLEQQAASLSHLSNLLFKAKRPFPQLRSAMNDGVAAVLGNPLVQDLLGVWTPVWGPCIYNATYSNGIPNNLVSYVPDNVAYVVKTLQYGYPVYAIAISGTNSKSWYSLLFQDMNVDPNQMVSWSTFTGVPGLPGKISKGTAGGLNVLLNLMVDQNSIANTGLTLSGWLSSYPFEATAQFISCGHSLGGMLGEALSVWMVDTRPNWNSGSPVQISTYPTAAPTIGDKNWSEHALDALENRYYGKYSLLDAISCAWDRINQVRSIYSPWGVNPALLVRAALLLIENKVKPVNPYVRGDGWETIPATFNPSAPGQSGQAWMNQVLYQHIAAYIEPLGFVEYDILQDAIYPQPVDS